MRLFSRSAEGRYALAALRHLALPVAVYKRAGDAFARVLANTAAEALPPPDASWWDACARALRDGVPADVAGTVGDRPCHVRAMPVGDDAVTLVYEFAPAAAAADPPASPEAQTILDAISDVVLVYPLSASGPGPLLAFNQAAVDTYGYAPETLRTMHVSDIVDPERTNLGQNIEELKRRREGRFDSVHITRDGHRLPMQTSARLFEYEGQLCVLAVCRDDAERRSFQRELARTNASLERSVAESKAQLETFTASLQVLHRVTTADHPTGEARARAFLDAGLEMFGLTHGIVSAIYPDPVTGQTMYRIDAARSPGDVLAVGTTIPLADTFCDDVLTQRATVSFADAAADERIACIAAHQERGLRAFIGTPVWAGDRIVGTLNYSSPEPRAADFTSFEHELIEILADAMGRRLEADATTAVPA